jgi:hypothetical protein
MHGSNATSSQPVFQLKSVPGSDICLIIASDGQVISAKKGSAKITIHVFDLDEDLPGLRF